MSIRCDLVALGLLAAGAAGVGAQSLDVQLLSQMDLYPSYSSCWGWTATGGKELALLGTSTGTSIVDVTVPTAPVELAFIPGVSSPWREMKTHDHYAYIVSEGSGAGMQIVDLDTAPPSLVATYSATFTTAHTITLADGYAYANGARLNGAAVGIRILDLANPVSPVDVGGWTQYYTHDSQVRADTLYAACINNDLVAVVNIANRSAPVTMTTFTWPGNNAHSVDLSADSNFLLTTDEVAGGHLHVFDINDLGNIHEVAVWTGNPDAIIHNVHVRGDLAYVSYYTEGVRVVDISTPSYPVEVGFYDTWPGESGGFNGNWEVYPYAASGNAYLTDISTGLYVVRYEQQMGGLSGTVRELGTSAPVPGARAGIAGGTEASSASNGFFKLYGAAGLRTLVTSVFGFEADTTAVLLVQGGSVTQDILLSRLPNSPVGGVVRSASGGTPIVSASLQLDGTPRAAVSDTLGGYALAQVPHGVYTITATRLGFAPSQQVVTVSQLPVELDFVLQPAALASDFEAGPDGWQRVSSASGEATTGLWIWADPVGSNSGFIQPEDDHSPDPGRFCWVTGNAASSSDSPGVADVDGGRTILQSPSFDLSSMTDARLAYWRWYSNNTGSNPGTDTLHVEISNDGGASWKVLETLLQTQNFWVQVDLDVSALLQPTASMRLRVIAEDLGGGSTVEAAFDDFMIYEATPADSRTPALVTRLDGNRPNPFNPSTGLRFELARPGMTSLRIYDVRGRLVRTLVAAQLPAGVHEREWDGRDGAGRSVASGVYLYALETPGFKASRSMVLVR